MDFFMPKETEELTTKIRNFVEQELFPLEEDFLLKGVDAVQAKLDEKRETVKAMGLWAPNHPQEFGGMGLDLLTHAIISEELGRSPFGHYVFGCQAPDAGNVELLELYANEENQEKYLRPLVQGKIRSCFSMTERETAGSNPLLLATTAIREGDEYVINGEKWFSTGADGATFSIVMAVTHPQADRYSRASMIIVPTDTKGFLNIGNTPIMGHAGKGYFSHSEIKFENCRVPVTNLLGPEGSGFVLAQERLGPGRIHHCMRWLGICVRSLELMCTRAATRVIAPNQTLGDKQMVQAWIAESAAEIQAARLAVLHTAWQIQNRGAKSARNEISMIKYTVANTMQRVIDRALQVHGGLGMTDYTILAFYYREERAARIYDGADEVHKASVAKQMLKKYRTS